MSYLHIQCVHACAHACMEVTFRPYKNLVLRASGNKGEWFSWACISCGKFCLNMLYTMKCPLHSPITCQFFQVHPNAQEKSQLSGMSRQKAHTSIAIRLGSSLLKVGSWAEFSAELLGADAKSVFSRDTPYLPYIQLLCSRVVLSFHMWRHLNCTFKALALKQGLLLRVANRSDHNMISQTNDF